MFVLKPLVMKWATILLFVLLSCSRGNDGSNPQEPEISFDINGVHFVHTGYQSGANGGVGIFALKSAGASYNFAGYTNAGNFIQLTISTPGDTLKCKSYSNPDVFISIKAGNDVYLFSQATGATVTSYQNGVVNGTFSGSAVKIVGATTVPVTFSNGAVKNVRINY